MPYDPDHDATSLSDSDIVKRILSGNTGLYDLLVRQYNRHLYRLTWSILQNEEDAEDVVQETYVRAYDHLSQFAGRSRFATWLTRIAIHEAWRKVERHNREDEMAAASVLLRNPRCPCHTPEQQFLTAEANVL